MQEPKRGQANIEPDIDLAEDDEAALPDSTEIDSGLVTGEAGTLALGREAILRHGAHAPSAPGVYRMTAANGDVLYVGKAKNIKKRILAYARPTGHATRIARMIAATAAVEFVTTATETEALLLEANLIKRLRPRFNVLLRDDKSFPYILITRGGLPAQICKHRGARSRDGEYFGPFAAVNAVNRTITALERAFLLRSCSDAVYESRTRPCLLHQIKRCSAPCTGEITHTGYARLVDEAIAFLSGKSRAVKEELAAEMDEAAAALDFERAAVLRDRLAALSAVQARQGINPRGVEEADVFALHQEGGFTCIEVFFFRAGQNWGNRAYFPKADRALAAEAVLASFLSQFYDDKPCPRLILLSHRPEECDLLAEALTLKSGRKVEVLVPQRGEKKELVDHATANAREALGRKLAESASQQRLLSALAATFGLAQPPRRIEVYDNSHIQGSNAVGAMIVAGPEGFQKSQYRKFNIRTAGLAPGDDYGMLREVFSRRFKRLLSEAPRAGGPLPGNEALAASPPEERGLAYDDVDSPPPERGRSVRSTGRGSQAARDPSPDHLRWSDPPLSGEGEVKSDSPALEGEAGAHQRAGSGVSGGELAAAGPDGKEPPTPTLPLKSLRPGARERGPGGGGGIEEYAVGAEDIDVADLSAASHSPWPDLVLIDGGAGQLAAAREIIDALGITDLPLVAIAKGPDRDAGRETFFIPEREPFRLPPRDPVLYFVERLRDEAHRFAVGSHRQRRKRDIREAGLQEIPGVGPARKRALLRHFGTLKAIERASVSDLAEVAGVSRETARRIYDYFHEAPH
ncbi:MAG: excinuclease ABC subunit UvrC [Xanthobacteraceae bacterium]